MGSEPPSSPERALQAALDALARRALTTAELTARLTRRGFAPAHVAAALDRLGELRLVDDAALAYNLALRRAEEGRRGPLAVRAELQRRGVARDSVDRAVDAAYQGDGTATAARRALDALTRHAAVPAGDRQARDRLLRRLVRRGFPAGSVLAALAGAGAQADDPTATDDADTDAEWQRDEP